MKRFISQWLINTLAVLVAVEVVPGIAYERPLDLLAASLVLGILNAVVRPILLFMTFPLLLFTLGMFTLVINALLLYFVGNLLQPHFSVTTFWSAFWGALLISIVSMILNGLTGQGRARVRFERRRRPPPPDHDGRGPVIDI